MRRINIWLWVRLGIALTIAGLLLKTWSWRHYDRHNLPVVKATAAQPTLETKQITMNEMHLGHKVWTIRAAEGSYDETRKLVLLRVIKLDFYQREQHVATINAPEGVLNTGTRDISLARGAVGQAQQRGVSFTASKVDWSADTQVLLGSGGVVVRQGIQEIRGDRFRADVALERVQLTGRVRANLHPLFSPAGLRDGR